MKEKKTWQGVARCYPRLVGGDVGSLAMKKNALLSHQIAVGRNARLFLLGLLCLWAELRMLCSVCPRPL
jgi:hypothetical protein